MQANNTRSYLLLPGLYTRVPELKITQPVLSVFVVALLTAGYSFTALLCFACRNELFQAEGVFLYAQRSITAQHLLMYITDPPSHRPPWASSR